MPALKNILLIGAGKSATACLEFLGKKSSDGSFIFTVADASLELLKTKTTAFPHVKIEALDATNSEQRANIIAGKNVVISLLPASLHSLIAVECVSQGVHLLNASYQDEKIMLLEKEIKEKGLLFISELGLDPGIDHMSAMKMITAIKNEGGVISSFVSHCGGLIAPEDDDNPWHYKISWNPRNIVLAGKAGAKYLQDGKEIDVNYRKLFDAANQVMVNGNLNESFGFYPNRDSLSYIDLYQLQTATTFMRTTLRAVDFLVGWSEIVALQLTNEEVKYNSDELSIAMILSQHLTENQLTDKWISMYENDKLKEQIHFLFSTDISTIKLHKGMVSICDVLQHCMEEKLVLQPTDRDMIVMQHDIDYTLHTESKSLSSTLVLKGDDAVHTAMAKTVGLPLAITALLILDNKISITGLHIPIIPEIYEPVLEALEQEGIVFKERFL